MSNYREFSSCQHVPERVADGLVAFGRDGDDHVNGGSLKNRSLDRWKLRRAIDSWMEIRNDMKYSEEFKSRALGEHLLTQKKRW